MTVSSEVKESVEEYLRRTRNSISSFTGSLEESSRSSESSQTSASDVDGESDIASGDVNQFSSNGHHDMPKEAIIKECSSDAILDNNAQTTNRREKQLGEYIRLLFVAFVTMFGILFSCLLYQGCSLLLEYRILFGTKAPITISPAHGVVSAHPSTVIPLSQLDADLRASEDFLNDDADYQFKTYRPNPELEASLAQKPIRLLVVGDSIARGVGHQNNCYPTFPETLGAVLSKHFGGRPVFWTASGEPGATMAKIAKEVHHNVMKNFNDTRDFENNSTDAPSVQKFYELFTNEMNGYTCNHDKSSVCESNDSHYSHDQSKWIKRLQYHEQLYHQSQFTGYDYVIAMAGVNDIKSVLVPFLVEDEESFIEDNMVVEVDDIAENKWGFKKELYRLIRDLNRVSGFHSEACSSSECTNENENVESKQLPHIIFPGFPAHHVPVKMGFFLRWIAIISNRIVESMKKVVESENPDQVLFSQICNDESTQHFVDNGHFGNELWEENVQLRLVHTNGKLCRDLKNEMDSFYSTSKARQEEGMLFPMLFSTDAVHPNDLGYEYFGRCIGRQIIERWKD